MEGDELQGDGTTEEPVSQAGEVEPGTPPPYRHTNGNRKWPDEAPDPHGEKPPMFSDQQWLFVIQVANGETQKYAAEIAQVNYETARHWLVRWRQLWGKEWPEKVKRIRPTRVDGTWTNKPVLVDGPAPWREASRYLIEDGGTLARMSLEAAMIGMADMLADPDRLQGMKPHEIKAIVDVGVRAAALARTIEVRDFGGANFQFLEQLAATGGNTPVIDQLSMAIVTLKSGAAVPDDEDEDVFELEPGERDDDDPWGEPEYADPD